jgi:hypothetical protein
MSNVNVLYGYQLLPDEPPFHMVTDHPMFVTVSNLALVCLKVVLEYSNSINQFISIVHRAQTNMSCAFQ